MEWGWKRAVKLLDTQGSRTRILPMEGLRGVAVSLVFLVHYSAIFGDFWEGAAIGRVLTFVGQYGVDLFFLISAYLIYGAVVRSRVAYGGFIRRRLQRLYPAFLAVFAIYLALSFVLPGESKLPAEPGRLWIYLLQNLLMLPGLFPIRPMITVAWSLSFEVFFYLSVPLLIAALRMRLWHPGLRIVFIVVLGAGVLLWSQFLDLPMHARMLQFLSGMALYDWKVLAGEAEPGRRLHALAMMAAILALPIAFLLEDSIALGAWAPYARTAWLTIALPIMAFSAFSGRGRLAAALSFRPLRWLGNMSYSYYLLHGLVLKGLGLVALKTLPGLGIAAFWGALPVAFAITVLGSFVLYALVEYPFSMAPAASPRPLPAGR